MGPIEALVTMISVGLMLDPIAHIVFAFAEAPGAPVQRLSEAMSTIGISVLIGGLSTGGSCSAMIFATIM
jgi:hypothetical protein